MDGPTRPSGSSQHGHAEFSPQSGKTASFSRNHLSPDIPAGLAPDLHRGAGTACVAHAGPVYPNLLLPNGPTATLNGLITHGIISNANNATISLDSLRVLFNNGHAYANVHTSAHPSGEIRDQVHPM